MAETPYNKQLLYQNNLEFRAVPSGKVRGYFSLLNFFDLFKTFFGVIKAIFSVFSIYPDVIFGKGGHGSFPALMAGRLFRIPVIIHESDSVPGRVNYWASKFAKKIAISFPEAVDAFPPKVRDRIAVTGNPIRKELMRPLHTGAHEFLNLSEDLPVILVLGGSQGAKRINDTLIDILPRLIEKYQVIHQTGKANYADVTSLAKVVIEKSEFKNRYKAFNYLDDLAMRMASGASDIVISRAGSSIFEIASWKIPAVLIPITESNGDHQRKNAYAYARSGAATVIEEKNLAPSVLYSEVERILTDEKRKDEMRQSAERFADPDAARKIARELLKIAVEHES